MNEFKIKLTAWHLEGHIMKGWDCPGYRALKEAVETKTGKPIEETFTAISWIDTVGNCEMGDYSVAYRALHNDQHFRFMGADKDDIGKEIVFKVI